MRSVRELLLIGAFGGALLGCKDDSTGLTGATIQFDFGTGDEASKLDLTLVH